MRLLQFLLNLFRLRPLSIPYRVLPLVPEVLQNLLLIPRRFALNRTSRTIILLSGAHKGRMVTRADVFMVAQAPPAKSRRGSFLGTLRAGMRHRSPDWVLFDADVVGVRTEDVE